jgi:phosphoglycerate dehydrogenase-like enzyme
MSQHPAIWTNTATLVGFIPGLSRAATPAQAEIALIGSKPLPIDDMPLLRGIFRCGVGTDNIPTEICQARGIEVRMPSEATIRYIHEETANFATLLVLRMLYRDIGTLDPWVKTPRPFLGDRRVLVVGTGRIGSMVAAKLRSLVDVCTYDSATDPPEKLTDLLPTVDCVTLHIPLTDATEGWIDAAWLAQLSDGTALVNTARGRIVDESALLAEVSWGRLTAAFDVYWQEPYRGPLRAHHPEGFLMSPHVASTNAAFLKGLAGDFTAFLDECVPNEVTV